MIKKIILLSFLLLFLNNCGYTPIYSKKSQNFQIDEIETSGEKKVNKLLYNKLKVYSNNPVAKKTFNLNIISKSTKTIIAKDKKGNPSQFSIELSIALQITDSFNNKVDRIFSESSAYDNNDNKFNLRKYEDNLIENMTETIFSEIILFIQTGNLS
tara:strand:+ start:68 stop:535 length:468 start_codon:yes stop_codon:yes gene_type:complete